MHSGKDNPAGWHPLGVQAQVEDLCHQALRRRLYRSVSLIRQVEQKIVQVYATDVMQTPVHLSIGQESIAAALCAHLNDDDLRIGTHRGHGLYLAGGGDLVAFFAELLGRGIGCAGGYGGSMHLTDRAHGLVGTTSIVGGCLPILAGLAMSLRPPLLAAALLGDGAADQGVFAESLNFAALKKLPALFVVENNRYSVYTPASQRRAASVAAVARAFGIETHEAPIEVSCDVFALYALLDAPIRRVRAGAGPLLVECHTVRALDHNGIRDDVAAGFRPPEEKALFEAHCPLKAARAAVAPALAAEVDAQVAGEIEAAYAAALAAAPAVLEAAS